MAVQYFVRSSSYARSSFSTAMTRAPAARERFGEYAGTRTDLEHGLTRDEIPRLDDVRESCRRVQEMLPK
jgi:hypothetical protein